MKKYISAFLTTTILFSSAALANRHTPYLGLGVGLVTSHHHVDANTAATSFNSFDLNKQSFMGSILAGWLFRLPGNWRTGLDVDFSLTSNEPDAALNSFGGSRDFVRVKSNWAAGGAVRLGYMLTQSTLLYVRAGFEYRNFHTSLWPINTALPQINTGRSKVGFVPGIGFEVDLTPRWILGGEFRSAYYGTFSSRNGNITNIIVKPRVDTYMLNLKYKFCSHY